MILLGLRLRITLKGENNTAPQAESNQLINQTEALVSVCTVTGKVS